MCILAGLKIILSFWKVSLNPCSEINSWHCSLVLETVWKRNVSSLKSEAGSRFQPSATDDLLAERNWRDGKLHPWRCNGVATRVAGLGHRWTAASPDQASNCASNFITEKGDVGKKNIFILAHVLAYCWLCHRPFGIWEWPQCVCSLALFNTVYFSWS